METRNFKMSENPKVYRIIASGREPEFEVEVFRIDEIRGSTAVGYCENTNTSYEIDLEDWHLTEYDAWMFTARYYSGQNATLAKQADKMAKTANRCLERAYHAGK